MTNSERAAADQRLMDAMHATRQRLYQGEMVDVHPACPRTPIRVIGWDLLSLLSARALHRELGEALAAIEAQFGEKPPELKVIECSCPNGYYCGKCKHKVLPEFPIEPTGLQKVTDQLVIAKEAVNLKETHRAMSPKELIVPDYTPVHPGIAPPGPASNLNAMKPVEPVVPPKCTGPGAPCGCSIHSAGEPLKPTFTMNYPKPEDAPGARETIWGSWSDFPTVAK